MVSPLEIFCCYARKDQSLLKELVIHLSPLQRRGLIVIWNDIDINAGAVWEEEIKKHLNTAQIILLCFCQVNSRPIYDRIVSQIQT